MDINSSGRCTSFATTAGPGASVDFERRLMNAMRAGAPLALLGTGCARGAVRAGDAQALDRAGTRTGDTVTGLVPARDGRLPRMPRALRCTNSWRLVAPSRTPSRA